MTIRIFEGHSPSPEDIERARNLPKDSCPRRYCWWWRSLGFEWDVPVEVGCTFERERDEGRLIESWTIPEFPCCRKDRESPVDQYEPREPHLLEDGFDIGRFGQPRYGWDGAD